MKTKKKTVTFQFKMFIKRYYLYGLLVLLLCLHIFFQFYNLLPWIQFGWDQSDNAWAAKRIVMDHNSPLVGMVAKQNTGFFIGPVYYYYISLFYYLTHMNPIASPIAAGVTSVIGFGVFYYCISRIFSPFVALIAVAISTFSYFLIWADRVQGPVQFIPIIAMIIFYALYKILMGSEKYIFLLAVGVGLSLSVHFTSLFYFPIVLLTLPFFPRTKKSLVYSLMGILIVFLFFSPILVSNFASKGSQGANLSNYIHTYYHGFHLRRVMQLTHDGFIEFLAILRFPVIDYLSGLFLPVFSIVYFLHNKVRMRQTKVLLYLCWLWFVIPWFAFSTYKGELTTYYFSMTRPIALMILAYLTYAIFLQRFILLKIAVAGFWLYFIYTNIVSFTQSSLDTGQFNFTDQQKLAHDHVQMKEPIAPYQMFPASYLYYYYTKIAPLTL